MGAAGLDYELITFARTFLDDSDLPNAVETGRDCFTLDHANKEGRCDPPTYSFERLN